MGSLKTYMQKTHNSTKRNYVERMMNDKVKCMIEAKKYSKNYWDGNRKYGYGGYQFIKNYWKPLAKKLIRDYKLNNESNVLDIGCGKGYLIYEIKKILPNINIVGIDISKYALKYSHPEIKKLLSIFDARKKLKFKNNYFDLTVSLATFHNFKLNELEIAITEVSRISKSSYIMVESYKDEEQLFNLQCWALTANTFMDNKEWIYLFKKFNYQGDYEFIYFQ